MSILQCLLFQPMNGFPVNVLQLESYHKLCRMPFRVTDWIHLCDPAYIDKSSPYYVYTHVPTTHIQSM